MSTERRAQYRVQVDPSEDLRVTIPNPEGDAFLGRLIDLSGSGAGASFPLSNCPVLAIGETAELVFTTQRLKTPLVIAARVQNRIEQHDSCRYGFLFLEGQLRDVDLSSDLRALFNRRKAVRVRPDPQSPINVELQALQGGLRVEGRLEDISASGVRIRLERQADSTLTAISTVTTSFSLPDCGVVSLTGHIRNRQLVEGSLSYGIEFDPELTDNFVSQQEIVVRFVMQRQRELLRQEPQKKEPSQPRQPADALAGKKKS